VAHDYTRFIILSDARTGSNLLQQALNSHPAIVCFREIFNLDPNYIDYDVEGWDPTSADDLALRQRDLRGFLRQRIFGDHDAAVRAVGFKFHYEHFWFGEDLIPALTEDAALKVIHLKRRNQFRTLVSLKMVEQTGEWMRHDEGKLKRQTLARKLTPSNVARAITQPAKSVRRIRKFLEPAQPPPVVEKTALNITYDECARFFFRSNHQITHFGGLFAEHPIEELTYETMVADPGTELARVQEFLGVPVADLSWTLRRQNPEPLRDLVANYDELKVGFAGTEPARFFDE
jgi:LPS sulfotransferase NodH